MNTCADCGDSCRGEFCSRCRRRRWHAARHAEKRAALKALPIPQHQPQRTDEEQAAAAARVAELREAKGDVRRLAEAARRFLARRGAP